MSCNKCELAEQVRLARVIAWNRFWLWAFTFVGVTAVVLSLAALYGTSSKVMYGMVLATQVSIFYLLHVFSEKSNGKKAFGKLTIALSRIINSVDGAVTYHAHVLETEEDRLAHRAHIYLGFDQHGFGARSGSWRVFPWLHKLHQVKYRTPIGSSMAMTPEQLVLFHEVGRRSFIRDNHLNVLSELDQLRQDCAVLANIIEATRANGSDGRLNTMKHLLLEMSKSSFHPEDIRGIWFSKHGSKSSGNAHIE